jgi:hypothetical protein
MQHMRTAVARGVARTPECGFKGCVMGTVNVRTADAQSSNAIEGAGKLPRSDTKEVRTWHTLVSVDRCGHRHRSQNTPSGQGENGLDHDSAARGPRRVPTGSLGTWLGWYTFPSWIGFAVAVVVAMILIGLYSGAKRR